MRITSKGQVTIPIEIRQKMGLFPDTEVEFRIEGNAVKLRKRSGTSSRRAEDIISRMRRKATVSMTTDEILALTRG